MGYILPVQNYQAQHYQDRVHQPERDPMPIDRIFPKRIESSFNALVNQERPLHSGGEAVLNSETENSDPPTPTSNYEKPIYAELTGIGGQINRYV